MGLLILFHSPLADISQITILIRSHIYIFQASFVCFFVFVFTALVKSITLIFFQATFFYKVMQLSDVGSASSWGRALNIVANFTFSITVSVPVQNNFSHRFTLLKRVRSREKLYCPVFVPLFRLILHFTGVKAFHSVTLVFCPSQSCYVPVRELMSQLRPKTGDGAFSTLAKSLQNNLPTAAKISLELK